jgi:uncharacterized membrane protein YkoI
MNKTQIAGAALAGLLTTGVFMGAVTAQTAQAEAEVSLQQAIEIALLEVPGTVEEAELESEDGALVYEIEILGADNQMFEVEIAAATGAVIEVEAEDADDDDDEDDDKGDTDKD